MKRSCEEVLEGGSSCDASVEETDNFCRKCGERVDKKKFKASVGVNILSGVVDKVVLQAVTDSTEKANQSVLHGSDNATQFICTDNANNDATKSNHVEVGSDDSTRKDSPDVGSDDATRKDSPDVGSDDATRKDSPDVGSDDATIKNRPDVGSDDATERDDIQIGSDAANEDATSKNQCGSASRSAWNYYDKYRYSYCQNCEDTGHISRHCPVMECGWCGDYDHKAHKCPEKRARRENY